MFGKKKIETLADLAERLRDIDIAILSTRAENGAIAGRPMSNNGEVDYNGALITSRRVRRTPSPISSATRRSASASRAGTASRSRSRDARA